jgi:protein translocase SEC61 complex gamma subunit
VVADVLALPCLGCLTHAEFSKIAQATSIGFAIMGFIGFFVKLIFIPINNIIVAGA